MLEQRWNTSGVSASNLAIFSHSLIEVKGCPKKGDIMDNKTAMIIIVASTVLMQTAIAIGYFKTYVLKK